MKYLTVLLLALMSQFSFSQDLIQSRQTSYYTYIFELSDQEARMIYKKDLWQVDETYFHTLVDSFPTDSKYTRALPVGHYLKAYTEKNKLRFDITTVQDFDVLIAKNNTDLSLQVLNLEGEILPDAHLRIGLKKIRFDEKTQSYRDKKSNRKGFLRITHNGFTSYYDLSRQYNNSALKRSTRKVVYETPLKYIWMPVRYVIFLPIDGVKSIVRGWPQGTIQRTARFFEKSFYKVACLFDDYYCDYYGSNDFEDKHKGYLVFNKPKYMPGDTVKFKAFIVNQKGKPVNVPADLFIQRPGKRIKLAHVQPYRAGAYKYEFFLHDSLELQLDRSYELWLEKKPGKILFSNSFYYEDYELKSIQLDLTVGSKDHYKGEDLLILAKGTDENDLNLLDGRIEVFVSPVKVKKYLGDYVFIPDTLAFWKEALDKEDETEILIPDSIFPAANLSYEVSVTLFTSDNERIVKREQADYFACRSELVYKLDRDSIEIAYELNGERCPVRARIYGVDNFGNRRSLTEGTLPLNLKINSYYSDYLVETDSLSTVINLSSEPSLIQCFTERSKDSIQLVVQNPRSLPFSYYIYKKNNEKSRGHTDSLDLNILTGNKQNYFVSVQYLWGGRLYDENYQIPCYDKKLNISVLEPRIVYPSQSAEIELFVTDQEGDPVPGVDLTAYALTKKFAYTAPQLPYLGDIGKSKSVINNFSFTEAEFHYNPGLDLDFESWKILAGLDSIEYYKFIYPGNEIYQTHYESDITQIAPFVASEGSIDPVHVVYIDQKPVYFSWSTHTQPYSFQVDSGYHHLKLRTSRKTIQIDSFYVKPGYKTILSVWDSIVHPHVSVIDAESRLSDVEKRILYKYIFPYRYEHGDYYGYIKQNGKVQFLKPGSAGTVRNMAGPVSPNLVDFQLIDKFSSSFIHEPGFEYEFQPGLLKMRSVDPKLRYPDYLGSPSGVQGLTDEVITVEDINKGWQEYLDWKRYSTARYTYPRITSAGRGKMMIHLAEDLCDKAVTAINILLFKHDDARFLRVYPGNSLEYHDLQKGYYQMIFFYPGADYGVIDSLYVAPGGKNYHHVSPPVVTEKDSFSIRVSNLIEESLFKPLPHFMEEQEEVKRIVTSYQQEFKFTGDGEVIEGYVYSEDGEALPGVSVVVEGTTFGTVTNFEGYYSIKVPNNRDKLIFSFIGFAMQEVEIGYNNQINVDLVEEAMHLDEVVVTAYGVRKSANLTASMAVVTTSGIPGLESNLVSSLDGKVAGVVVDDFYFADDQEFSIRIRGTNSIDFEASPLFVIDGVVYEGNIENLDPNLVKDMQVLKGEQATAIYGSRGSHGVVLINTGGSFKVTGPMAASGADFDETFLEAASQSSSIRNNFSDYAFWQPSLITDQEGKASFLVQFPDDVTSWKTYYLAMNDKMQTGQTEGIIKSYKPLMAQLAVPRFLVENDTALAIGKVLNYTNDSINLGTRFEVDSVLISEQERICTRSLVDTLELSAGKQDSISVKYYLEKKDGYFDGEQRLIPVFPIGLEETAGQFHVLDRDTTLEMRFDQISDFVTVYARVDVMDVLDTEISKLIKYKYACNEQLASKLKALLLDQNIHQFRTKNFKKRNQVNRVIRLLTRNQHEDGLWGWWKSSESSSMWISLHVMEALIQARDMGYRVNLDQGMITDQLILELEGRSPVEYKLRALRILKLMNARIDYASYAQRLEHTEKLTVEQQFRFIELKQHCGLVYSTDTLDNYQEQTIFGNIYYSADSLRYNIWNNDIQNTLVAYRILRADTIRNHDNTLRKIRNYLFENRSDGYWLNTYESAQIIETILPDLLNEDLKVEKPILNISGAIDRTVDEFPYEMVLSSSDSIEISKEGDYPVYITSYQRFWNPDPLEKVSDFEIHTHFDAEDSNCLEAGSETKLIVSLEVKKDADYVMINVPIPAGCSYGDKSGRSFHEVHREYFRNETSIFCENLKKGEYTFEISLIPRYSGRYTLNPAKVEMMYFPTFNANNGIRKLSIK